MREPMRAPGIVLRGLAMGVAEASPGVSGGTIALVTGIYDELLATLARLSPPALGVLRTEGVRGFWRRHNLGFAALLALGMALGLLGTVRLLLWLLEHHDRLVWAFFFGLMGVSAAGVGLQSSGRWLALLGVPGLAAGLGIASAAGLDAVAGAPAWALFGGGALAASAWLVPGVSGSFVLVLLGLYQPVLVAVDQRELGAMAILGAGIVCGVMVSSRFLARVVVTRREALLGLVTGLMAGSLLQLWPWRRGGDAVLPWDHVDPDPLLTVAACALGAGVAFGLLLAGRALRQT